ncbi:MAG TPA: FKBP-type peptidyl-prolyl cis-trans isomerase [Verrucomicrobiae bacterium]|nr:FKBP-type peptidyl-prolyl cis-trans isomerase [Verrucomicrobiae bacterium]
MKTILLIVTFVLGFAAPLLADGTNVLADDKSRYSYAIGIAVGQNLVRTLQLQDLEVDPGLVARGLSDVLSSNATLLTPEEIKQTLTTLQTQVRDRMQNRQTELAAKNLKEGEAFLATNKDNPGVMTLPDGLQYKILNEGDGATPVNGDTVTVNYRGTLLDGTEFDNSYKRGQPAEFPVNGVIRGWTEALEKMKVGSKWQLFIPANLAYGEQGRPGIPPNSVLIFDVELLSVKSQVDATSTSRPGNPNQPLTSDIIKVPSAEELKKGAKIEVLKPEDLKKLQQSQSSGTN